MKRRSTSLGRSLGALLAAVSLGAAVSCANGPADAPAPGAVDRETFVATYVDLRATAVRSETGTLDAAQRREILARHGATEEGLIAFAEAHGEDVAYMKGVWDEVETQLDAMRLTDTGRDVPR